MKSIKYKGKVLTENDIPNYIKNRYSHRSDMLELWVHAMKQRNKWAANNKDKVKVSRKKKYWSDPDKYRAETKKWWKDNPEKKKAMDAEYRKNNKESIAESRITTDFISLNVCSIGKIILLSFVLIII